MNRGTGKEPGLCKHVQVGQPSSLRRRYAETAVSRHLPPGPSMPPLQHMQMGVSVAAVQGCRQGRARRRRRRWRRPPAAPLSPRPARTKAHAAGGGDPHAAVVGSACCPEEAHGCGEAAGGWGGAGVSGGRSLLGWRCFVESGDRENAAGRRLQAWNWGHHRRKKLAALHWDALARGAPHRAHQSRPDFKKPAKHPQAPSCDAP